MNTPVIAYPPVATMQYGGNTYIACKPDRRPENRDAIVEELSVNGFPAIAYDGWIYILMA